MSLVIANNKEELTKPIKTLFTIYCTITSTILIGFGLMYCGIIPSTPGLLYLGIGISIMMAFVHLKITHMIYETKVTTEKINLENI